ncbi:hypothetical protein LCGC14_0909710 [marine sediment metagenome]|uniref:Uncharacterized protein n=1 Tax=marine sediment metagenome TaxID=412755 RepID=A0A0F9S0T3_9ZZZZ
MTDTLQDNESLIAEQLREAKLVELPSELKENPVIHRGDGELDAPMTVKELTSAGYVYVWDSRTFERAPVLYYMLPSILRRRREDGSFIWTTNDPKQLPKRGTMKCLLHKDSPNRERFDEMGLKTCKKSNIINAFEVKMHMLKKHPKEWNAIEDIRKERERQEDRAFQKTLYEAVGGKKNEPIETRDTTEPRPIDTPDETAGSKIVGTAEAPLYVSDKPPRKKRVAKVK